MLGMIEEGKDHPAIGKVRAYVREHLGEPIRLKEMARVPGMSESHLCRMFRKVSGLTLAD